MTRSASLRAAAPTPALRWWRSPRLRRLVLPLFALVVLALLASHAQEVDWAGAWRALRGYDAPTLTLAALLAAGSHALYGSFDLLGRGYTRHRLPAGTVWATAFVSYAFNLNLGSLVGGFGLRLRLYSRLGLPVGVIGRVIGLSLVTNWLGHAAAGGAVLLAGAIPVPEGWPLHGTALRLFGAALLAGVAGYLALCVLSPRRSWTLRGHRIELPPARIALMQLAISTLNWSLMGATIYVLLGGQVAYPTVLGVLLLAGIAGVLTHIPAGLGVLEAVFVTLLTGRLPQATVLGAMLAYRAIYYLLPLGVAIAAYFALEGTAQRRRVQN
ncbi:MAG: lysylphosphatidylglycerol synthase domain-containing protein [Betaproteobacteria bacterium]